MGFRHCSAGRKKHSIRDFKLFVFLKHHHDTKLFDSASTCSIELNNSNSPTTISPSTISPSTISPDLLSSSKTSTISPVSFAEDTPYSVEFSPCSAHKKRVSSSWFRSRKFDRRSPSGENLQPLDQNKSKSWSRKFNGSTLFKSRHTTQVNDENNEANVSSESNKFNEPSKSNKPNKSSKSTKDPETVMSEQEELDELEKNQLQTQRIDIVTPPGSDCSEIELDIQKFGSHKFKRDETMELLQPLDQIEDGNLNASNFHQYYSNLFSSPLVLQSPSNFYESPEAMNDNSSGEIFDAEDFATAVETDKAKYSEISVPTFEPIEASKAEEYYFNGRELRKYEEYQVTENEVHRRSVVGIVRDAFKLRDSSASPSKSKSKQGKSSGSPKGQESSFIVSVPAFRYNKSDIKNIADDIVSGTIKADDIDQQNTGILEGSEVNVSIKDSSFYSMDKSASKSSLVRFNDKAQLLVYDANETAELPERVKSLRYKADQSSCLSERNESHTILKAKENQNKEKELEAAVNTDTVPMSQFLLFFENHEKKRQNADSEDLSTMRRAQVLNYLQYYEEIQID